MSARYLLVPVLLGSLLACAPARTAAQEESGPAAAEASPDAVLTAARPVTVELHPSPELWREIRQIAAHAPAEAKTLRLTLEGVRPATEEVGIRVFLNLPETEGAALVADPTADPHYVGSVAFYEDPQRIAGGTGETRAFYLDAGKACRELAAFDALDDAEPLRVTIAAVPLRPDADVSGVEIPIGRVRLSVH